MKIEEIDKWLDNEYGVSYTELEELHDFVIEQDMKHQEEAEQEIERLNNIINGINNYCFKRMAELDDIRERDKKLEDFCDNKINAFLEVREKIKELERSDK